MIGAMLALEELESVIVSTSDAAADVRAVALEVQTEADCALVDAVKEMLDASGYVALRNLGVVTSGDHVHLDGQVPSYHLKQLAQSTAKRVPGVSRVVNCVQVIRGR